MTLAAVILFAVLIAGAFVEIPSPREPAPGPHLKIKQHARTARALKWSE